MNDSMNEWYNINTSKNGTIWEQRFLTFEKSDNLLDLHY